MMYRLSFWGSPLWGFPPPGCFPPGLHHHHYIQGIPPPRAFPTGFPHHGMDSLTQVTNSLTSAVHSVTSHTPMMVGSTTDDLERSPMSDDSNGLFNGQNSDQVSPVVPQFIPTRIDENPSIVSPSAGTISKRLSGSDLDELQPSAFIPTKKTKLDFSEDQDCVDSKVSPFYLVTNPPHPQKKKKKKKNSKRLSGSDLDESQPSAFIPTKKTKLDFSEPQDCFDSKVGPDLIVYLSLLALMLKELKKLKRDFWRSASVQVEIADLNSPRHLLTRR